MNRYDIAVATYTNAIETLRSNKQAYADYLKFSSGIYKYGFDDNVMIYQQNPHATKNLDETIASVLSTAIYHLIKVSISPVWIFTGILKISSHLQVLLDLFENLDKRNKR